MINTTEDDDPQPKASHMSVGARSRGSQTDPNDVTQTNTSTLISKSNITIRIGLIVVKLFTTTYLEKTAF